MKEWQLDQRQITENEQIEASFVVSGVVGVLEEWIHEEMVVMPANSHINYTSFSLRWNRNRKKGKRYVGR